MTTDRRKWDRNDPLASVTTVAAPDSQKIPGRPEMVRNAAGGYVFRKDSWRTLEDFLVLGTTGGTYYLSERELTLRNTDVVFSAVQEDACRVAALAATINTGRPPRAPNPKPQLFALAAVMAQGDAAGKQVGKAAGTALANPMLRTTDHLTTFAGYFKQLHGKTNGRGTSLVTGRAVLSLLRGWFKNPGVDTVAWRALKARQRKTPAGENMSLRDVLRIAHPKADSAERHALFGWLAGNVSDEQAREVIPAIDRYLRAQAVESAASAIGVVNELKVPWEFLPSAMLDDAAVWSALVDTIGMTALLRNLARMSRIGTFDAIGNDAVDRAIARLTNADAVVKARIHPMQVWLAQRVYASGRSEQRDRHGRTVKVATWTPNARIVDALDTMWEHSFGAFEPTGKRHIVIVDCSGSMTFSNQVTANGSPVGTAWQVANTMAVILARMEPNVAVINAGTRVHASQVTPQSRLAEVAHWQSPGGGTALAVGFDWARNGNLQADGITLLSDMESWAGQVHTSQSWRAYRQSVNPAARALFATLVPTGHTVADPKDESVLNTVGVDSSLPQILAAWLG